MTRLLGALVLGLGLAMGGVALVQAQGATCSAANARCKEACKDSVASPQCPSFCAKGFSDCKRTGCFPKSARFGGGATCDLKKS